MLAMQEISPPYQAPVVVLEAPASQALTCRCPACGDARVFDALAVTCRCADEAGGSDDRRSVVMNVGRVS